MPGDFDFENGAKNIQRFFDYCKDAGLYVIPRAGPYCNAETNGGGLALYGSDGSFGALRTGDETFYQSWKPWIEAVGKIIAENQITNGGVSINFLRYTSAKGLLLGTMARSRKDSFDILDGQVWEYWKMIKKKKKKEEGFKMIVIC